MAGLVPAIHAVRLAHGPNAQPTGSQQHGRLRRHWTTWMGGISRAITVQPQMSRHPFFPSDLARGWCATRSRVGSCVLGVISPRKTRGVCNAGRRGQEALKDAGAAPPRRVLELRFSALYLSTIFLSGKRNRCYRISMCLQRSPLVSLRDGFFEPMEKAKYLDVDTLSLEGLQLIEILQNGQSFLWKSLERNSRDLEKLARKLGALRPAGERARAIPPGRAWIATAERVRLPAGTCPRAMHERASVNFAAAHEIDLARFVRASFDSP